MEVIFSCSIFIRVEITESPAKNCIVEMKYHFIYAANENAGIKKEDCMYMLRNIFATQLPDKGTVIRYIKDMLCLFI